MSEIATFGGGCFWCLEAIFEPLIGVERVVSGYAGGRIPDPTYERVCGGATGHAEMIQVTFDPAQISYRELLELFFAFHDPTTLNAQGPDAGTQYRSIILTRSPEQDKIARDLIASLTREGVFDGPIVTAIEPLDIFWPAEEYHQHYYQRNPARAYCAAMIAPKMAKLRRSYASRLKPEGSQGRIG
ncbi:MAG TPA: peptide-methionine (S)-S-oxide reductase MsrA [Gemmatimonadales bacterium]|jgi:peptide-methionine (S)-S-oxide reductase